MVEDCEARLRDHDFVCSSEHRVHHAKFAAVDVLKEWIKKIPSGLSLFCDFTSSDSPDMLIQLFSLFCDSWKAVGGLVIKCHALLGNLKSNRIEERGGRLGSFRRDL